MEKQKIVVVCGPTACGKTSLSLDLAIKLNGEIINADSMQIYKNLDIGTAKPTKQELAQVKHHLIDFLPPETIFNVADYVDLAHKAIKDISQNGKTPILVGGTGLYISSLVNGITFTEQKIDLSARESLYNELEENGVDYIYNKLLEIDPEYANTVDKNNVKRIIRALEIYKQTGITMSQQIKTSLPKEKPYNAKILYLDFENRQTLYDRINYRVDLMLQNDLLNEVNYVYQNKDKFITAAQAIGYKEFFPYIENVKTLQQCSEDLKQASRRYAKRQITWFKKLEDCNKICVDTQDNLLTTALEIVNKP